MGINELTWSQLSAKYSRPARVIREAQSPEMQRKIATQTRIFNLKEKRQHDPDLYYDNLMKGKL